MEFYYYVKTVQINTFINAHYVYTRWFKYDRDDLCVNKSQFVPVIFEPPCTYIQLNPVITSSVYATSRLQRQILWNQLIIHC
jgi:hypothetical protein